VKETVQIKQPDPLVSKEILAEAIVRIGQAAERLQRDGGLNERAVVVLIQDYAPELTKKQIKTVLNALPRLREMYCR
jgi:hypothetical protein